MPDAERQLVQVEHWRCGEPVGSTVLWAPADLTEKQFQADIDVAEQKVLDADAALKDAGLTRGQAGYFFPQNVPPRGWWDGHQDISVADAQSLWEAEQATLREAFEKRQRAQRSFADHMVDLGYVFFWQETPRLHETLDWAHRHGSTIIYGGELPNSPPNTTLLGAPEQGPRLRKRGPVEQ